MWTHRGVADLRFFISQTPAYATRPDHGYGASASHGVPDHTAAVIGIFSLLLYHGGMARLS